MCGVLWSGNLWAEEGHGHDHGGHEHEENAVSIKPDIAKKSGIKLAIAEPGLIKKEIILNGRIVLNGDTTVNLRGRFPGIVREVPVKLGDKVQAGQTLAVIDSNVSLQDYTITAPVSGVLLERNTNVGDVVDDRTLFVIADLSTVWAKFHIFPKDAGSIREGQAVRVHTFDHDLDRETEGRITLFLPTADALSQTHVAIVPLENASGRWKPGLTVDGHVGVAEDQVAVMVPETALQMMEEKTVIFVQEGDKYEAHPVKTGRRDGKYVEILNGLNPGTRYVSEGSFIVKADIMKAGAGHDHAH
ncbi:MAG: efflux RND transporter periplasmic adaptor subunit [Alphaproteobacteria bacterium]|nr:efflux RND transporter periplasmic adaptor subunit [Alphaproteobacteria bacterium]